VWVNPKDIVVADDGVLVIPFEKAVLVAQIAADILKRDQKNRAKWYKILGLEPDETLASLNK
jgi:regulator of RNase E activity RraA